MSLETNVSIQFIQNSSKLSTIQPSHGQTVLDGNNSYEIFIFFFNIIAVGSVCILGMLGNLTSILVLQKDRHNRVAIFLLQVLALADSFLLVVSLVALTICYGFLKRYLPQFDKYIFPHMVKYINPIAIFSQCFVIWSTVLLALNRYAAVCRPFTSKKWLKLASARLQVAVVLCVSIALNLPRFFIYEIVEAPTNLFNNLICNETFSNSTLECNMTSRNITKSNGQQKTFIKSSLGKNEAFKLYYLSIFYTSIILVLPLVLLVALNVPLIRQLQRSKRCMKDNCLAYDGKNEDNITWTMVVIIIELVICHTPERICEIVQNLSGKESSHILLYAMNISNFLVILNSSTDFIVYYVLKTRFRREFWRKIYLCLKKEGDFSTEDGQTSMNQVGQLSVVRNGSKGQGNARLSDSDIEMDSKSSQNHYRRLNNLQKGQQKKISVVENQNTSEKLIRDTKKPHQNSIKPLSVQLNGGKLLSSVTSNSEQHSGVQTNNSRTSPMRSLEE